MNVFELFGSIVINNRDAKKSLNDTASHAERTGEKMRKAFKDIGGAAIKVGKAAIGGAMAIGTAWAANIESTRDYRTAMAKLDAAFQAHGHSAETAYNTYKELQRVLGDTDQATEAANHLAVLCDNERELDKWTDICTGVFATFGDSLPIEGLTEAANETAKTGELTGSLADALNWAGINEEDFQKKLEACRTEEERQNLIMDTLYWTYKNAADQYEETGASVLKANEAQEKLNKAMATIGEIGEPIMTGLKTWIADMVTAAAPHLETLIGKLSNFDETMTNDVWPWLQNKAQVYFGVELPDWETLKTDAATWWEKTKLNIEGITIWAMQIPDMPHESAEQLAAAVSTWWTTTAVPAIDSVSTWALKLFGHPVEDDAAITAHVAAWWKVKGDIVTNACNWTLRLFGMPKEDANTITTTVNTWWSQIVDQVESACTWTARFVGFGEWTKEDDAALAAFWDGVYNKIVNICNWKISLPTLPTEEEVNQLLADITSWWEGVKSQIKLTFGITPQVEAAYGAYQSDLSAAGGGGAVSSALTNSFTSNTDSFVDWGSVFGGFFSNASGLDYVPHDGYKTRLHKGEAVLNAADASEWRGGGGNIEALLSQIVANTGAGKSIVLDSGVMVGQLAPGMDGALGTIMGRKRRGN